MASKKTSKSNNWSAPKPGSYAPPAAEKAKHTSANIPSSAWSDRKGNSMTSRQPAAKYPAEATSSDNKWAVEWLKSDDGYGHKPDIFK
jgi:hypothetical protein